MDVKLDGHLFASKLIMEDKKKVIDLTKSLVQPRYILTYLKAKNKESLTNIKQVYNARFRFRKSERENNTKLQHLVTDESMQL